MLNGQNGKNRVSSGTLKINGVEIVNESDFNQKVDKIERTIVLQTANTISVELKSGPGSFITVSILSQPTNHPPVANAGPDQTVYMGDKVKLDGNKSSDIDGDPLTFHWSLTSTPSGSRATLSDSKTVNPIFVVDKPGAYVVQLIVNDGIEDSLPDAVTISTVNSRPVANAGPDQSVYVTDTVQLDGSKSTDVDGNLLTYKWSSTSAPQSTSITLSDPASVQPSFKVDNPGIYTVELIVNDGQLDSIPDTVTITTANSKPVANAGPDQTVYVRDKVKLDGSKSGDVDGDPLTFRWSFIFTSSGSLAVLSDAKAISPTFVVDLPGTYVVQLIVNDGKLDSLSDTVSITTANSRPVANADADQTVYVGDKVQLDGSRSSDPDKDPLTFFWSILSKPDQSAAVLDSAVIIKPTFMPDRSGLYVAQLIVNDGKVDSYPDTTTIMTSMRMVTVPNVVGMIQADAQSVIMGASLTVGTVTQSPRTTVPAGQVISQSPAAGSFLAEWSPVSLLISSGPPMVTVPDVVGMTQANAQSVITGAKLIVGAITQANSDTVPAGSVINENPAAGASIPEGSSVFLAISLGPAIPPLEITITSPSDGDTVNLSKTMVKGTITSVTRDIGITINGIVAEIIGNNWIANNIPLTIGSNTITAVATDSNGNTASKAIAVTTNSNTQFVTLSSNVTSGISPLQVVFAVSTSNFIPSTYQMDFDGDGVVDYTGTTLDGISFTYTIEGVFYPKVTVSDGQSNTYSDTIAITVLSKPEIDTLLTGKWDGMKKSLASNDINEALSNFMEESRALYSDIFNALQTQLPQIVQGMQDIQLVYLKNGFAKYRMRKNELYGGQILTITYYVYFAVDTKGVWKIYKF